jgi:putative nucleotidyltransferase with HDIG domain
MLGARHAASRAYANQETMRVGMTHETVEKSAREVIEITAGIKVRGAAHHSEADGHFAELIGPLNPQNPPIDLRDRVRDTLERLSRTGALPALASTATAALGIARDPKGDIAKLCRILSGDVGMVARVLRMANSAAIARRTTAHTVDDAVMALGLRKTCDILIGVCARHLYETPTPRTSVLWSHAIAVAVAAEELAVSTRRVDSRLAFLPGLFHDVGRIAFFLTDGEMAEVVEAVIASGEEEATDIERQWYGFDHAEAGATLAQDWGLAAEQCDAIRRHHQPSGVIDLATILNAADVIAYRIGTGAGTCPPASVSTGVLGLSPDEEATCVERARASFAAYQELLG